MEGTIDGARYRIGSPAHCGLADDTAGTAVVLAREGVPLARFVLDDRLRSDARDLVDALRRSGCRLHLVSGDSAAAVDAVADALGIENRRARATPGQKQDYLRVLQEGGRVVAMVGDGINDAPVLAQADVSIAMASGAQLAQARADAVLLSNRLADLANAVALSRKTVRVVRENLAWATVYNLAVIPAAIAGLVTPWMAGIGMSGSSLAVVLNALRLRGAAGPLDRHRRVR